MEGDSGLRIATIVLAVLLFLFIVCTIIGKRRLDSMQRTAPNFCLFVQRVRTMRAKSRRFTISRRRYTIRDLIVVPFVLANPIYVQHENVKIAIRRRQR